MAGNALTTLKTLYASGAQGAGRALTKVGLLGQDPPPRDQRWRHWAFSLTRVHDSLAIAELDVPWWTYGAIDAVEGWIDGRARPIRAFEWGAGASTLWLSRRVDVISTVEHHRAFADDIGPTLEALPEVTFRLVEPVVSSAPKVPSAKEGYKGLDFADYVAAIDCSDARYDLVVIDGRAREACLHAAVPHLAEDGIIVFDNTRRRRYRASMAAEPVSADAFPGLTPTLPYPDETSICRKV